MNLNEFIVYPM